MNDLIWISSIINLILCACSADTATYGSWVACTDYDIRSGFLMQSWYDDSKCRGYPRGFDRLRQTDGSYVFGVQPNGRSLVYQPHYPRGFNQRQRPNEFSAVYQPCQSGTTSNPATYEVGKEYCIVWPARSHVTRSCDITGVTYNPSFGTYMYMARYTPGKEATQQDLNLNPLITDFSPAPFCKHGDDSCRHTNGRVDYKGYHHCWSFFLCNAPNETPCTGCFTIPADTPSGTYTFQWKVQHSNQYQGGLPTASQFYFSNCWEATVIVASNLMKSN